MSLIAEAFVPQTVAGLVSLDGRVEPCRFADLITDRRSAYDVNFDNATQEIKLDFRFCDPVAKFLAGDCSRLSSSALQSIAGCEAQVGNTDDLPWVLVKLYYSAFYAGNVLTRLLGTSCVFLDRDHCRRIIDFGAALARAPTFQVDAGQYRVVVNSAGTELSISKLNSALGGSHEQFWALFLPAWQAASGNVLKGPLDRQESQQVFAKLAQFDRMFSRNKGSSWLPRIRNEVQYHHAYDVWFRCAVSKKDRDALSRVVRKWRDDPMSMDIDQLGGPLGEFATGCVFVTAVCHALLRRMQSGSRPRGRRSFLNYGPMAFLSTIEAASR